MTHRSLSLSEFEVRPVFARSIERTMIRAYTDVHITNLECMDGKVSLLEIPLAGLQKAALLASLNR